MEINITKFFTDNQCPRDYSASRMELGQHAGDITWRASCEDAKENAFLDTPEKRDAFIKFARESGFGDDEAWPLPDHELDALFLQWVAGDCREMGLNVPSNFVDIAWSRIVADQENGLVPSNIFKGIDGEIYFYAGS